MTLQSNEATTWADFFVRVEVLETPSLGGLFLLEVGIQNILLLCCSSIYRVPKQLGLLPPFRFFLHLSLMPFPGGKNTILPRPEVFPFCLIMFYTKCLELRLNSPACKHYFLLFENQNCICLPPDFCPSLIIHNSV